MRATENRFIRNVSLLPNYYAAIAFTGYCLQSIEQCCISGTSVFRCDNTFEIIDNLRLTDTSIANIPLIKAENDTHPEFPGPVMVHFTKDDSTYRCFASELVNGRPQLSNIKQIGHDMDMAIKYGLTTIFSSCAKISFLVSEKTFGTVEGSGSSRIIR